MKVTIEKVDKLVERADVSYEVAKEALESANGDLLDAVILLEREGKLGPEAGQKRTKVYTTGSGMPPAIIGQAYGGDGALQTRVEPNFTAGTAPGQQDGGEYTQQTGGAHYQQGSGTYYQQGGSNAGRQQAGGQQGAGPYKYRDETVQSEENVKRFFFWIGRVIRGGCINYFEVWRRNERVLYFPVILFLFCFIHWVFWVFLAFLLIGLLCGCKYKFSGPHLGRDSANDTADKTPGMSEEEKNN